MTDEGSTNHDEHDTYADLITFLHPSQRLDVRIAATEACLTVSSHSDERTKLIERGVLPHLCRLISRPDASGVNALKALLNLSSTESASAAAVAEELIESNAIGRLTEASLSSVDEGEEDEEQWRLRVNLALGLLANLTRSERGAVEFVGKSMPDEAVPTSTTATGATEGEKGEVGRLPSKPTVTLLLSRFLNESYIDQEAFSTEGSSGDDGGIGNDEDDGKERREGEDDGAADPYQHVAAIVMNATQLESGRKFVTRIHRPNNPNNIDGGGHKDEASGGEGTTVLQSLLPQLRSLNPLRRRGVAGVLKNVCFDTDSAWWLLHTLHLGTHLLYPLAGPEELDPDDKRGLHPDLWMDGPDKIRETDATTRLLLVESILLLLASGRASRETLRLQKTYVILKMADLVEEREEISERINECVQYLRRDEAGEEEGSSDRRVSSAYSNNNNNKAAGRLALPAPEEAKEDGGAGEARRSDDKDYDNVD